MTPTAPQAASRLDDILFELAKLEDEDVQAHHAELHAAPLLPHLGADDKVVYGARILDVCKGVERETVRRWLDAADNDIAERLYLHLVPDEVARLRARREARRIVDSMVDGGEATGPQSWTMAELLADPSVVELPAPVLHLLAWPGRVTLLAAPEKLGKSTFVGAGFAAVSSAAQWLGEATISGPVLWAAEEHPGDVVRRLARFGAKPGAVTIMRWGADPVGEIRAQVERLRPVLVVVDTLQAIAEHARPESGRASDWAAIMRPLVRMARELEVAVVILHHARRSDGEYRDSSEIAAAVDVVMTMSGSETDTLRRLSWRGRYGRGSYAVRLCGQWYELLDREDDGEALADEIMRHIAAHPGAGAKAVQRAVRGRDVDVRRTLADLLATGRLIDQGTEHRRRYHVAKPAPKSGAGGASDYAPAPAAPAAPDTGRGRIQQDSTAAKLPAPRATRSVGAGAVAERATDPKVKL